MTLRLVLWDFDGTLADTGADVWASLAYAAGRCGGKLPEGFVCDDANLGMPMAEIFRRVEPFPGPGAFDRFDEDVRVHYRMINDYPRTRLYPGVLGLLGRVRRERIRSAIVTNKPRQALERLLEAKGWSSLFDGWITPDWPVNRLDGLAYGGCAGGSGTGTDGMDKTAMIARMIARFAATPAECVYVGDTWSDVAAAHANGVSCIAVTYGDGDTEALLARSPEHCVDDVGGVERALLGVDDGLSSYGLPDGMAAASGAQAAMAVETAAKTARTAMIERRTAA